MTPVYIVPNVIPTSNSSYLTHVQTEERLANSDLITSEKPTKCFGRVLVQKQLLLTEMLSELFIVRFFFQVSIKALLT